MKIKLILFISFLGASCLRAQKEDNVWVFGYRYSFLPLANGIYFKFGDSLNILYGSKPMSTDNSNASICDSNGVLQFISNGCYIETGNGEYVNNSSGLNPGWLYNEECIDDSLGYPNLQSMVFLPSSGDPNLYYLFHIPLKVVFQPTLDAYNNALLYTIVETAGNGAVLEKNMVVVSDTLHPDGLASVRHANGRDWWIIVAKYRSNKYYTVLLTPDGISVKEQNIGESAMANAGGEIVFSPDGTKMARFNCKDDLRIFDFDRCTGVLSKPVYIPIQDNADNEIFAGLAFSADGHYLYAAEIKRMLQFDMWAPDIASSMVIVAERDLNTTCNLGKAIGYLELGPDGMIYCRPLNGQSCMHRMKHPERAGAAAEFVQYYYEFDFSYKNLPHFPNFRLGPVDGSPCDTLGLDNHPLAGWRYDKTEGLSVDFTSVSWYEPDTWWWDFGDGAQSNERNPTHTFPAPGAYEVCLSVSNEYGTDTKCKWVWLNTSGIKPLSSGEGLGVRLFPNPSTGQIFWTGLEDQPVTILVYNQLGQKMAHYHTAENSIDLSALTDGMYHIQIVSSAQILLLSRSIMINRD